MKKTLQKLLERYPDKIEEISDETALGDGYWIYLKAGWRREECDFVHAVHEWDLRELTKAMKWICPCDCEECRSDKGGGEMSTV